MPSVNILMRNSLISPFSPQTFREKRTERRDPVPLCTSNSEKIFLEIRCDWSLPLQIKTFISAPYSRNFSRVRKKSGALRSSNLDYPAQDSCTLKNKKSGAAHTQNCVYAYTKGFRDFRAQEPEIQQLLTILAKIQSTFSCTNSLAAPANCTASKRTFSTAPKVGERIDAGRQPLTVCPN